MTLKPRTQEGTVALLKVAETTGKLYRCSRSAHIAVCVSFASVEAPSHWSTLGLDMLQQMSYS